LTSLNKSESKEYSIELVVRIAEILNCLSDGKNTLVEVTKSSKLSRSTVHRLLNALLEPHLTTYDSVNHRYYLGPAITRLAIKTSEPHKFLISCAIDEMQHLSEVTGETVSLSVMVGMELMSLYTVESRFSLKVTEDFPNVDSISPFGAAQKVLLSQLNKEELSFARNKMLIWGKRKKISFDLKKLELELDEIKKLGFSISHGEKKTGVLAISAPIKNYVCPVSLNLIGPDSRLLEKQKQFSRYVIASAKRISTHVKRFNK
jgi:IclR family transcriptional regulator, acetate operon repressor